MEIMDGNNNNKFYGLYFFTTWVSQCQIHYIQLINLLYLLWTNAASMFKWRLLKCILSPSKQTLAQFL